MKKKDITFILLGLGITLTGIIVPIMFYGIDVYKDKGFVVAYGGVLLLLNLICYYVYKLDNDKDSAKLKENFEPLMFSHPMLYVALQEVKNNDESMQDHKGDE